MADNVSKSSMKGDVKDGGKKVADKAGAALEGAFSKLGGDVAAVLKGLKDSLGIPDLPKIPKKPAFPALKKFEPKKAPTPKIYEKEEKKFDYAKAEPIAMPAPKPAPPEPVLVETYKGYQIYKKQQGPFVQFFTKSGDRIIRSGPESRSESDETLLKYERSQIDARISKLSGNS